MEEQVIEKENTTEKKNMPLFILKIVGNVLFYLVIVALLLFSIMNIRAGNRTNDFPNIFGKGFLSVQTNSMDGDREDSFKAGDLIIVSVFKEKKANELKVGDVITFYDSTVNDNKGGLNSHRIVYIGDGEVTSVMVQGDKSMKDRNWVYNQDPDHSTQESKQNDAELIASGDVQSVSVKDIKGVMTGVWRGAGKTMDNIQEYWLFIFVLPVLLFLIFEIFMVVKNVIALNNEKQKSKVNPDAVIDIEAQKEQLRAQILAELQAEQEKLHPQEEVTETTEEAPVAEATVVAEPVVVESVEQPVVEEEPVVEPTPAEAAPVEEKTETPSEPIVEEPTQEPVMEQTPVEEEAPVAEEEPVEEKAEIPSEPIENISEPVNAEPIEEVQEPVKEEKPKPVRKRSTSSTTEKKSSSTTKKTSTGTKSSSSTTKKASTGTKKSASGTTKKASTGTKSSSSTTKKASAGTKSSSTTKKASTGTKKSASGTTKKASTGTKKASSGTTKKSSSGAKTEKGE